MVKVHLECRRRSGAAVTENVLQVMGMFGLGADDGREVQVLAGMDLELRGGEVVFVTGPSGSGKSTILRLIASELAQSPADGTPRHEAVRVVVMEEGKEEGEGRPLVDALGCNLEETLEILSLAGLGDAFVMLRRPGELSEGQRYRWRLAQAMAAAREGGRVEQGRPPDSAPGEAGELLVLLADEFAAMLDRTTARIIARNVGKWVRRSGRVCLVAASAQDDLLEALEPEVLVYKDLGPGVEVMRREKEKGEGGES